MRARVVDRHPLLGHQVIPERDRFAQELEGVRLRLVRHALKGHGPPLLGPRVVVVVDLGIGELGRGATASRPRGLRGPDGDEGDDDGRAQRLEQQQGGQQPPAGRRPTHVCCGLGGVGSANREVLVSTTICSGAGDALHLHFTPSPKKQETAAAHDARLPTGQPMQRNPSESNRIESNQSQSDRSRPRSESS